MRDICILYFYQYFLNYRLILQRSILPIFKMLHLKHYFKCIIKVNFWGQMNKVVWQKYICSCCLILWLDLTWPLSGLDLTCLICLYCDLMVGTWDLLGTWTCVTCPHLWYTVTQPFQTLFAPKRRTKMNFVWSISGSLGLFAYNYIYIKTCVVTRIPSNEVLPKIH